MINDGLLAATSDRGNIRIYNEEIQRVLETSGLEVDPGADRLASQISELPALLDVDEAAKLLGFTPRAIRGLVERGALPSRRLGRWVRIPTAAIIPMLSGFGDGVPR